MMPAQSFLCCLMLVLLTAPTVCAQAPEGEDAPLKTAARDVAATTAPEGVPAEPVPYVIDTRPGFFDRNWLDTEYVPPRYKYWVNAEYMVVWLNDVAVPPLISSSPPGFALGTAAVLNSGAPVAIVAGNHDLSVNAYSGLRLSAGAWLNSLEDRGIEANGFLVIDRSRTIAASGNGSSSSIALARPIVSIFTRSETAFYSAYPDVVAGSSAARMSTGLGGFDINALARAELVDSISITLLGGARYLNLDQSVEIEDRITPIGTSTVPIATLATITNPNIVRINDAFRTSNRFIGGQLGFRTNLDLGRIGLGLGFKLGLGQTHQSLTISGTSDAVTPSGQPIASFPGGILANATNIGRYEHNAFSVVPEFDLKISYRVLDNLCAFVSYDYLLWNHTVPPGAQISRTVNVTNVPTSSSFFFSPGAVGHATLSQTNFAFNSLTFGFCFTY
jgi:hypothetical protein